MTYLPLGEGGDAAAAGDLAWLGEYGVPAGAAARLREGLAGMEVRGFDFPWEGLEAVVGEGLKLVGYGSLLNPASAVRTIRDTPAEGHPPVVAAGAVRVFNYAMPEGAVLRYGETPEARCTAALNLIYTGCGTDVFNGRLMEVALRDLPGLREREHGYDLRPVVCLRWGDWEAAPVTAYVLVARREVVDGRRVVDDALLPHAGYARVCRAGAAAVSDAFSAVVFEDDVAGGPENGPGDVGRGSSGMPLMEKR